jgi:hypothetical protein
MSAAAPQIDFTTRKPYTVTYYKRGEKITIKRRPPPKIHDMLPTDIVQLSENRSAEFRANDKLTVKNINQRSPNVLQVEKKDGQTTFVSYADLIVKKKRNEAHEEVQKIRDSYLYWP